MKEAEQGALVAQSKAGSLSEAEATVRCRLTLA
jgi:hypothetical protein